MEEKRIGPKKGLACGRREKFAIHVGGITEEECRYQREFMRKNAGGRTDS